MNLENELKYDEKGLIPAIIQEHESKRILMLAYMNKVSFKKTLETGQTHFWSRSRQKYWLKGESSGHTQQVRNIFIDCDKDSIVIEVDQNIAACHKGYYSCFYRKINILQKTFDTIEQKIF